MCTQTHKSRFTWVECFRELKELPKWNAKSQEPRTPPPARGRGSDLAVLEERNIRLYPTRLTGCRKSIMLVVPPPMLAPLIGCRLLEGL
jgi:hypothetical protein